MIVETDQRLAKIREVKEFLNLSALLKSNLRRFVPLIRKTRRGGQPFA